MTSNLGMGCWYLKVILLMAWLFTHIPMVPSFLGTRRVGTAQGLRFSRTNPFQMSSSTCLWITWMSLGFIRYVGWLERMAPGRRSIWCWMVLLGGKLDGISSGKTCEKFCRSLRARGCVGTSVWSWVRVKRIISLGGLNSWCSANRVGWRKEW